MCNCKSTLKIKFKKLDPTATTPKYAKFGDAGMDLVATSIKSTEDFFQYGTGIAVEIPTGYVGLLFPRSSNSKKDLLMCNSVGVIDSGYRGEILARFKPTHDDPHLYEIGDAVVQLMIIPFPEVQFEEAEELSDSERGSGNFGHTGA